MIQEARDIESGQDLPEDVKKDAVAYKTLLTKIMHGKENRDNVVQLLASYGQPELAVPNAAIMLTDQAEQVTKQKVPDELKLGLSAYLVGDLIEIGVAAKLWDKPPEEEAQNIYKDTVQDYIQRGLKNKTIDVTQLQKETEPLMSEEQKQLGLQAAQQTGVPEQLNPHGAIAQMKLDAQQEGREQGSAGVAAGVSGKGGAI